jgi:hypothetical protein
MVEVIVAVVCLLLSAFQVDSFKVYSIAFYPFHSIKAKSETKCLSIISPLNHMSLLVPRRQEFKHHAIPCSQFVPATIFNGLPAIALAFSKQQSLTPTGLLHATALGIGIWSFLGFPGWIVGVSYLVLGSVATKIKMKEKEVLFWCSPNNSDKPTILHAR